ncbi:MAG: DNA adenine methylase [Cyanophyceae cyanobacterium]
MKPSPVLKWAGGKTQLLPQIEKNYPPELNASISTYIEPFVGGGAVFFNVVSNFNLQQSYLFDTNADLVILYKVIQKDVETLIQELTKLEECYLNRENHYRKTFYYSCRDRYNTFNKQVNTESYSKSWAKRAALTVFLNRTCFNGLYRVNSQGHFNVPAGQYKNPTICHAQNLKAVSQALQSAHIAQRDFSEVLKYADSHTFIYYDPPYRPISKTASFNSYAASEFNDDEQRRLRDVFAAASHKGALQMLSNSDPTNYVNDPFFDELYKEFKIKRVMASRAINSKADRRGAIREILVTNY